MSETKTVLVVDDDPHLREIVSFSLRKAGYEVVLATNGLEALDVFRTSTPDLVVLDVMMAKMDGTETCREIRKTSNVPIVFLTSVSDEVDRIIGLELGADDYVTKPFSPRELVARIKALFRRIDLTSRTQAEGPSEPSATLVIGSVRLDLDAHKAYAGETELGLTAIEFRLLLALMRRPGKVFERDSLMTHAYSDNTVVSGRTIDSHIRKIRQKFSTCGLDPIETVHGVGYQFAAAKAAGK